MICFVSHNETLLLPKLEDISSRRKINKGWSFVEKLLEEFNTIFSVLKIISSNEKKLLCKWLEF